MALCHRVTSTDTGVYACRYDAFLQTMGFVTLPICEEDLKKLYESDVFNQNSPETLQNKVFFEVMLYFCRRGRQNLRELKKTDFSFSTDGETCHYCVAYFFVVL